MPPKPTPPPVAALPTAITAFVGNARRGPAGEAVRIRSLVEFERVFGGLSRDAPLS